MFKAHGDFETRGTVDLKKEGLDRYCADPNTDVLCMAYAFDEGRVTLWRPGDLPPSALLEHVAAGGIFVGHNVTFEHQIWNRVCVPRYGWPPLKTAQCRCTMAMALAMRLPASLENALIATGCSTRKDSEGRRIMLQLSQPRKREPLTWWTREEFPEKYERLYSYCRQDVVSEMELLTKLAPLSDEEQRVWELDQEINARGVAFDRRAASCADAVVDLEKKRLDLQIQATTTGYVGTCQSHAALVKWIQFNGISTESVDKAAVASLLATETLPPAVRTALTIRQEAARSSMSKLDSMLTSGSDDDRVRFIFQYHAAGTGRWGGRRVQPQNFPRPKLKQKEIEGVLNILRSYGPAAASDGIAFMYGNPLEVLPSCLRGFLCAGEGKELVGGDYSNIEGRILAWSAGEQWKLDAFRAFDAGTGPDLYKLTYARSFGVPIKEVDDNLRQIGKVEELALGYQGWEGAFITMGRNYGVELPRERVIEICAAWRRAHPEIVKYWKELENAAVYAVGNPDTKVPVRGGCSFMMHGDHLWLQLPSGRVLCYPYAELFTKVREYEKDDGTYYTRETTQVRYLSEDSVTRQWGWAETYGGSWAENITQAISRDILAAAMLRLHDLGYVDIVLHVHDEAVIEVISSSEITPKEFSQFMAESPPWAEGLPIAVAGWRNKCYGKH